MDDQSITDIPRERLWQALVDGFVVKVGGIDVPLRHQHIGDLLVTSGDIVVWDPLWVDQNTPHLARSIPPGRYPVVVATAKLPSGVEQPAYATLRLSDRPPVDWAVASFDSGDTSFRPGNSIPGYPVDTGIGSFMDRTAARILAQRMVQDREYHMVISRGMEETIAQGWGWGWGMLSLEPDTSANVAYFTAGPGDGDYPSYWGYHADGAAVCLTTDFAYGWYDISGGHG
jgi:hypothetical protein